MTPQIIKNPQPILTPVQTPMRSNGMSFTEFNEAIQSEDLTTLQKQDIYVNTNFIWDGEVEDVTQDTVIIYIRKWVNYNTDDVTNYYKKYCEYYNEDIKRRQSCLQTKIWLHVRDDQKSQLNSLSKGSIITFEGTIKDKSINFIYGINMYDGKIID